MLYHALCLCFVKFCTCIYSLFQVFYPLFNIVDLATGQVTEFLGQYTLKIVGGGLDLDTMRDYTPQEQQSFNFKSEGWVAWYSCIWCYFCSIQFYCSLCNTPLTTKTAFCSYIMFWMGGTNIFHPTYLFVFVHTLFWTVRSTSSLIWAAETKTLATIPVFNRSTNGIQ